MPRWLTNMDHPALAATEYSLIYGGVRYANAPRTKQVKQRDGSFVARPNSLSTNSVLREMGMMFLISFAYEWLLTNAGINAALPQFNYDGKPSTKGRKLQAKQEAENESNANLNGDLDSGSRGITNDTPVPDAINTSVNTGEDP